MVQLLWKTVWWFSKELNIELTFDLAIPLQGIYPKEVKTSVQRFVHRDFPGGSVVKNPPANAGDTGSIPGPGRSHMPQSN